MLLANQITPYSLSLFALKIAQPTCAFDPESLALCVMCHNPDMEKWRCMIEGLQVRDDQWSLNIFAPTEISTLASSLFLFAILLSSYPLYKLKFAICNRTQIVRFSNFEIQTNVDIRK